MLVAKTKRVFRLEAVVNVLRVPFDGVDMKTLSRVFYKDPGLLLIAYHVIVGAGVNSLKDGVSINVPRQYVFHDVYFAAMGPVAIFLFAGKHPYRRT